MKKKAQLRPGIVAIIINDKNHVLMCERNDRKNVWQFPQGGIDKNEKARQALFRELLEEIGNNKVEILKVGKKKTTYLFPEKVKGNDGSIQKWYLCRFLPGEKPDLSRSDCFVDYKWKSPKAALKLLVEWKRAAFAQGFAQLGLQ